MKYKIIIILFLLLFSSYLYGDPNSFVSSDSEVAMSDFQFYKILFILVGGLILGCIKISYAFWFLAVTFLMASGNCIFTMQDWSCAAIILIFIPILAVQGVKGAIK